jgi:hypothetical protein
VANIFFENVGLFKFLSIYLRPVGDQARLVQLARMSLEQGLAFVGPAAMSECTMTTPHAVSCGTNVSAAGWQA